MQSPGIHCPVLVHLHSPKPYAQDGLAAQTSNSALATSPTSPHLQPSNSPQSDFLLLLPVEPSRDTGTPAIVRTGRSPYSGPSSPASWIDSTEPAAASLRAAPSRLLQMESPALHAGGGAASLSPTSPVSIRSLGVANGSQKRKRSAGGHMSTMDSSPGSIADDHDVGDHSEKKRQPGVKRACNECRQQKVSHLPFLPPPPPFPGTPTTPLLPTPGLRLPKLYSISRCCYAPFLFIFFYFLFSFFFFSVRSYPPHGMACWEPYQGRSPPVFDGHSPRLFSPGPLLQLVVANARFAPRPYSCAAMSCRTPSRAVRGATASSSSARSSPTSSASASGRSTPRWRERSKSCAAPCRRPARRASPSTRRTRPTTPSCTRPSSTAPTPTPATPP
ncbi:hypothetical protein VTK73DRAFT_9451 [Phialemonium thermophilum]|uniref:Uncharacterized protein n=1 Tax=Phialemonium thermophilum TaxID=223376 RepID=A0ABR3W2W6_9PEZI